MSARGLRVCVAVALLLIASVSVAQDVTRRRYELKFKDGVAHLSVTASDLLDDQARKKLSSGLPQRLVVQHFVYARGRQEPIAVTGHSCRVVYDLWQTSYRLQRETVGEPEKAETLQSVDDVLSRCLVMREVPIGKRGTYPRGMRFHFASLVELNPLSKYTLARIRRWLSRPGGGDSVDGNSFFGSFVSLFVNHRIGSAERSLKLRSQDFKVR